MSLIPMLGSHVAWFAVKAVIGIAFVVALTKVCGGSIALGLLIGTALAFLAALSAEQGAA
jgi:hypothetical protein